ncbi:MAG TPA: hypothetical protein VHI13_21640 [Candidatus Kapabacteria bacterium]|nr:hypothetical protein [Candidatus Kapabacteria bacterium]
MNRYRPPTLAHLLLLIAPTGMLAATVVFGGSLTFNQNISIAAGATALKLKRLNPQYAEGMRLEERIAPGQLHRIVYGVNPLSPSPFASRIICSGDDGTE